MARPKLAVRKGAAVMPDMVGDEGLDEVVRVVITRLPTQLERLPGLTAGLLQKMRMELRLQELVRLALVDQDLRRPRASPDELGRIVGPPGIAIRPEVVRECLVAPRAAHGRANGRECRHGAESLRVPERGHERAVAAHGMSEYAEAPPVHGEIRRDQRGQLLRDVGVHAVAIAPGRLRCVDVKAGAEAEIPSVSSPGWRRSRGLVSGAIRASPAAAAWGMAPAFVMNVSSLQVRPAR